MKLSGRKIISSLLGAVFLMQLVACSALVGSLRRDLDDGQTYDGPTVGGRWTERGFLSDDMSDGGPFSDGARGPASTPGSDGEQGSSWLSSDRADANQRDSVREGGFSSSTVPNLEPGTRRQYKNGMRATKADFLDESTNEGSLWASDGQTNYYFTKNKIRNTGDIVTVNLEAELVKDIGSEVRRTLTPKEKEWEIELAQKRLHDKVMGLAPPEKDAVSTTAAAPARVEPPKSADGKTGSTQAPDKDVPTATYSDIEVLKSLEFKVGDTMMAEIVERYPNGHYRILGRKRISYKGGNPRDIAIVGIVKSTDISEEDVINSGKLYEYQIKSSH